MKTITWIMAGLMGLIGGSALVAQDMSGISGVPGDGIPDVYYFPSDGLSVETSVGTITRPAGDLTIDTDGNDMVAVFIGGPDATASCNLCDGMNLPGIDALANSSNWVLGYSAGSNQWIRVNPLTGRGFSGVLGEAFLDENGNVMPWPADLPPFLDFPEQGKGLLNLGPGLDEDDFTRVFGDNSSATWNVQVATNASGGFFTDVTVVPEPSAALLVLFAASSVLGLRRRE